MKLIFNNYLLLTCLVGYLGAIKFRCDCSYSDVGWFKYHLIPATWQDARLRCHFEGGMLASPTNTKIKNTMINAIGEQDIFTGIHATFSHGNFYSIDGIPLDVISHRWAESEPDNKNNAENCISMNSAGNFSDVSCDEPRPYMCFRANTIKTQDTNVCGTPDSEYRFDVRTKKCYKFHKIPRTFDHAHLACTAEGGHLAIINSKTEHQVIRDIFARYPERTMIGNFRKDVAFIGFHNFGQSTDWTTLHGETLKEAGFDHFFTGDPNNATYGENCGSVFRNGYLNDLWCDKPFAFICEKLATYPPVCDTLGHE